MLRLPAFTVGTDLTLRVAEGCLARAWGLAGLSSLPRGEALLIPACRSVHTFGMRFRIDLVWIGAGGAPIRVDAGVRPARLRSHRRACAVIETRAGEGPAFAAALAGGDARRSKRSAR